MHYTGLAIIHHLLAFGLVIMLAMELAYLRGDTVPVKRLTGLDAGYGGVAVLVLLVGAARVVWGEKGWEFYQTNPFFWAKIATFSAIGLISIAPTIAFIRWSRAFKADPVFRPQAAEVRRMAGLVRIEVLLLLPLAAFAAAMARWAG
jgi:putative membrane protein